MAEDRTPLSPRETAMRMLTHLEDDVSYEDIIRQLRILQQIEWVMDDVDLAGLSDEAPARAPADDIEENTIPTRYAADKSALVLRSRPLFSWRSLAERSEDQSGPFIGKASWIL